MQHIELPEDYSLVLQEVCENGEQDFTELAESLNFEQGRLRHIIQSLQHKGLISLSGAGFNGRGMWIRLSAKGRKLMSVLWPESGMSYGY
jgi:DNA-binding MarR family transcriptional regulator